MTAITVEGSEAAGSVSAGPVKKSRLAWAISDTLAMTNRNLIALRRVPATLVFSTIQPVIFVLLFRYVFGGAIEVPGAIPYVDFLMPGIFVQTVTFGAVNTAVGLSDDLTKGFIERFRSLPMARSAVLSGRTVADLVRDVFVVFLMVVVGMLVGFRFHSSVAEFALAMFVLLFFAFSLAWVMAFVGLGSPNGEAAQAASFPFVATLVFASPAFVPVSSMPTWLQGFANYQPVGATVNAVRSLCIGGDSLTTGTTASWTVLSLIWSIVIIGVAAPLAVRTYRKVA